MTAGGATGHPLLDRLVAAMVAEDLPGVLACFDPEGSFQDPTGTHRGLGELEAFFSLAFALVRDITWEVHRWFGSGDLLCLEWSFG